MNFKALFKRKNTDGFSAGLTILDGAFKYVLLERRDNDVCLISSALADTYAAGEQENPYSGVFRKLSGFVKNKKVPLAVSLPFTEIMMKVLHLPMKLKDAEMSLRYEIENFFPVSSNEAVFDIAGVDFPFDEQYDGEHYLVAVTKKSKVKALAEAAHANGFEIDSVEPAQTAIERAVSLYSGHNDEAVLFICLDTEYVQYILSWHGNGIFYRTSYFNSYTDTENAAVGKLSEEFRTGILVKEIKVLLEESYRETKISPKSAALIGPAADYQLCKTLQMQFAPLKFDCLNVTELNGIEMINIDNKNSQWDIATGLALRHFDL